MVFYGDLMDFVGKEVKKVKKEGNDTLFSFLGATKTAVKNVVNEVNTAVENAGKKCKDILVGQRRESKDLVNKIKSEPKNMKQSLDDTTKTLTNESLASISTDISKTYEDTHKFGIDTIGQTRTRQYETPTSLLNITNGKIKAVKEDEEKMCKDVYNEAEKNMQQTKEDEQGLQDRLNNVLSLIPKVSSDLANRLLSLLEPEVFWKFFSKVLKAIWGEVEIEEK